MYHITLDNSEGQRLGVEVDGSNGTTLLITSILGGLVQEFNGMCEDRCVSVGDHIIAVNSIRGDAEKLLQEIQHKRLLNMMLSDNPEEVSRLLSVQAASWASAGWPDEEGDHNSIKQSIDYSGRRTIAVQTESSDLLDTCWLDDWAAGQLVKVVIRKWRAAIACMKASEVDAVPEAWREEAATDVAASKRLAVGFAAWAIYAKATVSAQAQLRDQLTELENVGQQTAKAPLAGLKMQVQTLMQSAHTSGQLEEAMSSIGNTKREIAGTVNVKRSNSRRLSAKSLFDQVDKDGNGSISKVELQIAIISNADVAKKLKQMNVFTREDVTAFFDTFDTDCNGTLSYNEFAVVWNEMEKTKETFGRP